MTVRSASRTASESDVWIVATPSCVGAMRATSLRQRLGNGQHQAKQLDSTDPDPAASRSASWCPSGWRPAIEAYPASECWAIRRHNDYATRPNGMRQHAFNLEFDSGPVARKYPRALRQQRPDIVSVTGIHERSNTGLGDGCVPIVDSPPDAAAGAGGDHRARPFSRDRRVAARGVEGRGTRAQRAQSVTVASGRVST